MEQALRGGAYGARAMEHGLAWNKGYGASARRRSLWSKRSGARASKEQGLWSKRKGAKPMEQSLAEHGLRGRGRRRTGKDTRPKIGKRPRGKTTTKGPGRAPLKSATILVLDYNYTFM